MQKKDDEIAAKSSHVEQLQCSLMAARVALSQAQSDLDIATLRAASDVRTLELRLQAVGYSVIHLSVSNMLRWCLVVHLQMGCFIYYRSSLFVLLSYVGGEKSL